MNKRYLLIIVLIIIISLMVSCGLTREESASLKRVNEYMDASETNDQKAMYKCYPPSITKAGESLANAFGSLFGIEDGYDLGMDFSSNIAGSLMEQADIKVKYNYIKVLESEFEDDYGYIEVLYEMIIKQGRETEKSRVLASASMIKEKRQWYITQPVSIIDYNDSDATGRKVKINDFIFSKKNKDVDLSDDSANEEIEETFGLFFESIGDAFEIENKPKESNSIQKLDEGEGFVEQLTRFINEIFGEKTLDESINDFVEASISEETDEASDYSEDIPEAEEVLNTNDIENDELDFEQNLDQVDIDEAESEPDIDENNEDVVGNYEEESDQDRYLLMDTIVSSELEDYPALNMLDNNLKTTWSEAESGFGIGTKLKFLFEDSKFDSFAFINGYTKSEELYYKNGRVKYLDIEIGLSNGETIEEEKVRFSDDTMGYQIYSFDSMDSNVEYIELTIRGVYQGSRYSDTCISEMVFGDIKPEELEYELDETKETNVDNDYMIPGSDERYISESELEVLSKSEVRIARNELYARYGYTFSRDDLKLYFNSKSWYEENSRYNYDSPPKLNEIEDVNRRLISRYEDKMGW